MRAFSSFFVLFCVALGSLAAERPQPLRIWAYHRDSPVGGDHDDGFVRVVTVWILIENVSEAPVRISTKPNWVSFGGSTEVTMIDIKIVEPDAGGPSSDQGLGIVALAPGKIVGFEVADTTKSTALNKVVIQYRVDGELPKRLGLWNGVLSCVSERLVSP